MEKKKNSVFVVEVKIFFQTLMDMNMTISGSICEWHGRAVVSTVAAHCPETCI